MKTSEYESDCMVQNNHNCEYENLLHEQLTDRSQRSETVKRQCITWLKENDMPWHAYENDSK